MQLPNLNFSPSISSRSIPSYIKLFFTFSNFAPSFLVCHHSSLQFFTPTTSRSASIFSSQSNLPFGLLHSAITKLIFCVKHFNEEKNLKRSNYLLKWSYPVCAFKKYISSTSKKPALPAHIKLFFTFSPCFSVCHHSSTVLYAHQFYISFHLSIQSNFPFSLLHRAITRPKFFSKHFN